MNITITSRSGGGSSAGKGCATVFLGVFALMGLAFSFFFASAAWDTVRAYSWKKTDCVIESSAVREKGDSSEFTVRYRYSFAGRDYTGTRFTTGMSSSVNEASAQRAAQRYTANRPAYCYVNAAAPAESTLERGTLWPLLFGLIPLVFVAVGVGGIIAVWRAKPANATAVSERHRTAKGGTIGLQLFGLVFIAVGGGMLYAFFILPMMRQSAAAKWPVVPCEILSSKIGRHSGGKGGPTYSVDVRYRYKIGGTEFTGTNYNFDTGSSSSRAWREEAVASLPQGKKTVCRVNPQDSLDAVLSIEPTSDRWFGLIPGVFFIVGLLIFFCAPRMANRNISRTGLPPDSLPQLPRHPATGEVELRQASSPLTGCIVMLIFALLWNGITWVILLNMPHGEWFPRIFLGIFALIGAVLGAAVIYTFLAIFNPRPVLTASAGAIPLGGELAVRWRFTGNVRRITKLIITLEAREEATYRRGTTTTTDKCIFAILPLLDNADRAQIVGGSAKVIVPRDLIHTFTAPNNKIVWMLRVHGDIPRWPDVSAEFPITVLPREAATLFHEENPTP